MFPVVFKVMSTSGYSCLKSSNSVWCKFRPVLSLKMVTFTLGATDFSKTNVFKPIFEKSDKLFALAYSEIAFEHGHQHVDSFLGECVWELPSAAPT